MQETNNCSRGKKGNPTRLVASIELVVEAFKKLANLGRFILKAKKLRSKNSAPLQMAG